MAESSESRTEASLDRRQPPLDEASLRRVRAREAGAMEDFFEHYFDRVHDYLRRMFQDPADADDTLQETFLRVSRNLERIEPERDPTGWVFRIATNAMHDHWRASTRGARGLESDFDSAWNTAPPDPAENAQERLEREEDAALVQRALDRLSAADREIVLLRDYEELSTAEIGVSLGLAPDAVRQRHSRAVRRLGQSYAKLRGEERSS